MIPGRRILPNSLVGQDMWFSPTRPGFESRLGNFWLLRIFYFQTRVSKNFSVFGMPYTMALNFRLDGRAVQGAGFRHQSLRRRGFESHSNQLPFCLLRMHFYFKCVVLETHRFATPVSGLSIAHMTSWSFRPKKYSRPLGAQLGFASVVPPSSVGRAQDS